MISLAKLVRQLERFPIRLTRKLQGSWPESALDSMFVAFPIGKLVSTIPGNALSRPDLFADAVEIQMQDFLDEALAH
jgi:hypothetical protein